MDFTAIQALVTSLKTAAEVSKALFDLKLTSEVQVKVSELQSALLSAQNSALAATAAQFELQERLRELETKLRLMDEWSDEKSRYALVAPWRGPAQVYALRKSASHGEHPHFLCTNCFDGGKKVILNPARVANRAIMLCPNCKATLETGYSGVGAAKYAEEFIAAEPSSSQPTSDEESRD